MLRGPVNFRLTIVKLFYREKILDEDEDKSIFPKLDEGN